MASTVAPFLYLIHFQEEKKMKKTLSLILALTLICGVFSACDIGKTPSESVGLEYEVNPDGKTCTITGIGTCKDTDLVIPSTIDGYSVTKIGYMAFYNCSELMSLIVPDSVTSIGNVAFYECSSLMSITIPDSVTSIGSGAFYRTAYYNNDDNWSGGVLYIGNYLIKAQSEKISGDYTVKEGIKNIPDSAFKGCYKLTSITIPDSVTSIGNAAFRDCSGLTSITIPDSLTSVGDYAFAWCDSLTSIMFNGTKVQWNYFIRKGSYWNNNTGDYTIHCADGDLKK